MLDLAANGYTAEQVIDALHGRSGSRGKVTFRYDLLSKEDVKLGELTAQSGRVALNSLAEIKRTAVFQITEQEAQDVDWLNDRIRPVFCLKMPEIRKTYKAWGKIDTSFSRSSIAYLSDGAQVAANRPRFEPGKFGKAVMVEEGTTNLVQNPLAKNDLTAIVAGFFGGSAGTLERVTELPDRCPWTTGLKATVTVAGDANIVFKQTDGSNEAATSIPVSSNTVYSFSIWLYIPVDSGITTLLLRPIEWTSENVFVKDSHITHLQEKGVWKRVSAAWTTQETTGKVSLRIRASGSGVFYATACMLEQKPYATSFIDGTRDAESLTIPTAGVLNPQEGTVECWVMAQDSYVRRRDIFTVNEPVATQDRIILGYNVTGTGLELNWRPANAAQFFIRATDISSDTDWVHVGFRYKWNGTGYDLALIYNGRVVSAGIATNGQMTNFINAFLGCTKNGSTYMYFADMLFDDLRISSRALTDAEILAAYQSGRPAPIDEWTTAKFDFDNRLTGEYFTIVNDSKPVQWIEWPLGVFLLSSPTRKDENRKVKRSIEAYDSSLILKEDKFTDRYVIEAGTKYTDAIIDILNAAGIWKINIIDHPGRLATDREFEIGTSKLTAINELLAAINYTSLWVDENGYFVAQPYVLPSNRDPEYEYRTDDLSIIHPGAEEELDLFAVPNKWVRYVSNPDRNIVLRSEYINDLSTSPTSTTNRGRTIVDIDHVEDIYDQATLNEYVKRIAYNASQVYGKFEFATALMPHHSYYNCLFVEYKDLNIAHKYMESSWSMDLQPGGTMTHSCRKVIRI